MRRISLLVAVGALIALVVFLPQPKEASTAPPVEDTADGAADVDTARSIGRCPWVRGDAFLDGSVVLAAVDEVQATITVSEAGEVVASVERPVPGFAGVAFSELTDTGTGSALVEFDGEPAGAVSVGAGERAAASAGCRSGTSKRWLLAGGDTTAGESLQLRLFNPFPQDARVDIRVVSENDLEPEPTLDSVTVGAQTTATFDLSELITLREVLALAITDAEGLVVPALVQAAEVEDAEGAKIDADLAAWSAVAPSTRWEFPFAAIEGIETSITLFNDQTVPVEWSMDAVRGEGADRAVAAGTLEPLATVRIPVSDLGSGTFGVVLSAESPIGAFLTGKGPTQRGATEGLRGPSSSWLVPGIGVLPGPSAVWVMNTGVAPATVTIRPSAGEAPEAVRVPPGAVRIVRSETDLSIESDSPVSVAWIHRSAGAISFTTGIPVDDE